MITYESRFGLYQLYIPTQPWSGYSRYRYFAKRGDAARLLGRYVTRYGLDRQGESVRSEATYGMPRGHYVECYAGYKWIAEVSQ